MKTLRLFFLITGSIVALSSHVYGMSTMHDQAFDQFFIRNESLDKLPIKLEKRSIIGSVLLGKQSLYPLEYALWTWPRRAMNKATRSTVTYTDSLVLAWIEKLLKANPSMQFKEQFNPLVCLLYLYGTGNMTTTLFLDLLKLLRTYGAQPDDTTEDRHVLGKIKQNTDATAWEKFVQKGRTVSAKNLLTQMDDGQIIATEHYKSVFNVLYNEPIRPAMDGTDGSTPKVDEKGTDNTISKSSSFTRRHAAVLGVVTILVCTGVTVGIKYLYDWYTESKDDKHEPANSDTHEQDVQNTIAL